MRQATPERSADPGPSRAPATVARRRGPLLAGRGGRVGLGLGGIAATLAALELCSRAGVLPAQWFPPVSAMYAELGRLAVGRPLWVEIARTLRGWAIGIGIAACLAVPAGIALGSNPVALRMVRVVVEFFRPVPSVALIPLAVLVYGTGLSMKVFLIAFGTFWPLLLQTIYGVRDVDPVARDTARSYGLPPLARFRHVTLPSTAPYIATGLRIASSIALILAVTAELVTGAPGLGRAIVIAESAGAVTRMYALIIAAGMLGWGLNTGLVAVERRLLRWHPARRDEVAR